MKKFARQFLLLLLLLCCAHPAWSGQIKAYVAGFAVTGAQNRDEMRTALQTLLMSRLSGEAIIAVDSPAGADITVTGSYVVFGRIFSIDALAKNSAGNVLARAFVQGESQDELIPAVGKLAKTLADEVVKGYLPGPPTQAAPPQQRSAAGDIVKKEPAPAATSEIVRPQGIERTAGSGWVSQRLTGALTGIALGRTLASGERELFIAGNKDLRFYQQGKELKLLAEVGVGGNEKILSLDSADLDGDGVPELYLTVMRDDALASQVWVPAGNSLKKVAENLPYFLRAMALEGKEKKVYAQEMSSDNDFYGDVFELAKTGNGFTLKNPLKLPKFGYLYNFNKFTDNQGKSYFVLFNRDGYLLVYSQEGEELWRSSDKFGGSELSFQRPDLKNVQITGSSFRTVFLDQRITVTKDGEILVPQNAGFWVLGNSRSYSKNSVFSFTWNGSTLEEKWHTRQSQNYLADFSYDEKAKELFLLEVVKKEGMIGKGASAVYIKKVE